MQMTDKERFKKLLEDFELPFLETITPQDKQEVIIGKTENYRYNVPCSDKVEGYTGFHAVFTFEWDGSFIKLGVWE